MTMLTENPAVPDEDTMDLDSIAESLSALARAGRVPTCAVDCGRLGGEFGPADVDFLSNDWLQKVLDVEPWLNLDPLPRDEGAATIARHLFQGVRESTETTEICFLVSSDGRVQLTAVGAEHLDNHLSKAAQHRAAFEELLEDGAPTSDASDHWQTRWSEDHTQARRQIGTINAKVDTWKIKAFKGNAEERLLDLDPSYQRDVVWSNSESQKLIESIARGIPLPSLILTHDPSTKKWQIVDGKQRLTSILRFMGYHPTAMAFAEKAEGGLELMHTNFRKFFKDNKLTPKDLRDQRLPFKFRNVTDKDDPLYPLSNRYYCEIKDAEVSIQGSKTTFKTVFESEASEFLIPVIIYKDTDLQDIHHVFGLYNKQGKKLNAEELRNAVFHHLHITRLLLVISGDRGDTEPARHELAPYLPANLAERCVSVGATLMEHHNFGVARFKRTKLLSWTCAILLHKPPTNGDAIITPSTAGHIDDMLRTIKDQRETHRLYQVGPLTDLARDLQDCILAHAESEDAWAPKFKNRKGVNARWDELPLVASFLGLLLVNAGDRLGQLPTNIARLREVTQGIQKLTKSQNRTQWIYIAQAATRIMDVFGVDEAVVDRQLEERYGYSCLPILRSLAKFTYN